LAIIPSFGKAGQLNTKKTSDVNGDNGAMSSNKSGEQNRRAHELLLQQKGHVMAKHRSLKKNEKLLKPN